MTETCLRIGTGAMRKIGVLPIGREPTAAQGEQFMVTLQAMYNELVGQGVFGRLIDSKITASTYTAHEGERVVINTTVTTVTIPTTITTEWGYAPVGGPYDYGWGAWPSTLPRPPHDNAIIQVARSNLGSALTYIYDAPRATWAVLEGLVLADIAPLSERYGEALKSILALKLCSPFNVEPTQILLDEYARANSILSTRFDRSHRQPSGQYM